MNILIIANADHSGAGYALMQAINKTTEHKARAICHKRSWIGYDFDLFNLSHQELLKWVKWSDVLNLHDESLQYVPRTKKPVVTTYHGSWFRSQKEKIIQRDKELCFVSTALTLDLCDESVRWIGRAIPELKHNPNSDFTVVHAPTQRHRKGTATIIEAMKQVDAKLSLIEKMPYKNCLKLKAKGHVLIDQVGNNALGYGTNALEAWAMGMPVISNAPDSVLWKIVSMCGYVPFLIARNKDDIIKHINRLKNDATFYHEWRDAGIKFVRDYHSENYVAREFISACLSARDKRKG